MTNTTADDRPAPPTPTARPQSGVAPLLLRLAIGVVVLVMAIGIAAVLVKNKPVPPTSFEDDTLLSVSVVTLSPVQAPRVWNGYGTARAERSAEVTCEVPGVVEMRPEGVHPGEPVNAGDLLVRLESREYRDLAAQARAVVDAVRADLEALETETESLQESFKLAQQAVEITESELRRFVDARETAGINQIEIDRLTRTLTEVRRQREDLKRQIDLIPTRRARLGAQLERDRASLRLAELSVERTEVRAPIDGVLQRVDIDKGDRAAPGQPVARIVDLTTIEIPVRAPVSSAAMLRVGDAATLSTGGLPPSTWAGVIERIAPEADVDTRTITVYVVVEQDPETTADMLMPGRYLIARLSSATKIARIVVPRSAVQSDRVVVVDGENRARPVDVNIAFHIEGSFPAIHPDETQWSVIDAGLSAGDRVVLELGDSISPGLHLDPRDVLDASAVASPNGANDEGAGS